MLKKLLLLYCAAGLAACAETGTSGPAAPSLAGEARLARTGDKWFDGAQETLAARKAIAPITGHAKNVILFVADGMDPTTVTAARIYDGQSRGEEGEENLLSFERFPYVAMSKTYNTNLQVPDSAGTMSAMVTGVKTKAGVLSVTDAIVPGDCASALASPATTLGELAKQQGLSVGVISTAEITHATPAAVYAHSASRGWQADSAMPEEAKAAGCKDIASQLIEFPYGDGIDLAMGGGRAHFIPNTEADPEDEGAAGARADGRDLTAEWTAKSDNHVYVWNEEQLAAAPEDAKILGLFEPSHMEFEATRASDPAGEPSLADMTEKAISILSKNPEGFFLVIESGKVDHAHHMGNAYRALTDTQEYAQAVEAARAMTSEQDTLIVVTADHGHTMSFQGYPRKGTDILGVVETIGDSGEPEPSLALDGKPYTTLGYANGPGTIFNPQLDLSDGRPSPENTTELEYRQQSLIPTGGETHGGQDVQIFASGPRAFLFGGVVEQNYIFHVIADALELQ